MKKKFRDGFAIVVATLVAALFLKGFVIEAYKIPSASMSPELLNGDFLFVNKFVYNFHLKQIHRGDVVAFHFPNESDEYVVKGTALIKRCVGVAGDTVEMLNGVVKVNSQEFQKNYMMFAESFSPVIVPPNHIFVLGDNLLESYDSREWGTLPIENVIGQAMIIYFSKGEKGIRWNRIGKKIH
jgi:signal peptidase I